MGSFLSPPTPARPAREGTHPAKAGSDRSGYLHQMILVTGATGYVGGRLVPRLLEAVVPGRSLRLRAEMKVPGRAWLQFEAIPRDGGSLLTQTAYFAPRGLAGHLYWYALYPVHAAIFRNLIRRIAERARALATPVLPEALP